MIYNFDKAIDRRNTNSLKYDFAVSRGKTHDTIPLWIADMDFAAPPCVLDALRIAIDHGIFGYSETAERYSSVLQDWFIRHFAWQIRPEWVVQTPGVVTALHVAISGLTKPGDAIIIQQPVYPPFFSSITSTGRRPVINQLMPVANTYEIDFDDFEAKIVSQKVKMFILCSPHNPVGRVWTKDELIKLGDICLKHGVIVIADEIHADLVFDGHKQLVFSDLKPEYLDITITCTAPSKTFNIAGLQLANNIVANKNMRDTFINQLYANGLSQSNALGIVACEAAYRHGDAWLQQLNIYLAANRDYMRGYLASELPQITMADLQGTYLAWLDFSALGLSPVQLNDFVSNKAKLWLTDGPAFGAGGEGFQRINIGCTRETLRSALQRLKNAIDIL